MPPPATLFTLTPKGELVGKLYCEEMFPPESKARAHEIVSHVKNELRNMLGTLDRMSKATRREVLAGSNPQG